MEFSKEILSDSKCSLVSTEKRKKIRRIRRGNEVVYAHQISFGSKFTLLQAFDSDLVEFMTLPLDSRSNALLPPNFLVSKPMIMKNIYDDEDNSLHTNYWVSILHISADKSKYEEILTYNQKSSWSIIVRATPPQRQNRLSI